MVFDIWFRWWIKKYLGLADCVSPTNTHPIFLGFKFLVRSHEKNDLLCRGSRKIRGISWPIFLSNLSKKWTKKGAQIFPKKIFIFLEHNFLPLIQFLLHFYALIFFRYQIFQFFPSISSILASQNHFFILVNSLFSLSVFLVRNSLSWNSLIPHSSWGIAMRILLIHTHAFWSFEEVVLDN